MTSSTNTLQQAPYARHVLFCTGSYCDPQGKSHALYASLARKLGKLGRYDNPQRIKRGVTPCLGVCAGGPLLVVYPDGVWYHNIDEAKLDRIIREHLHGGQPVQEYIFHQLTTHALPALGSVRIDPLPANVDHSRTDSPAVTQTVTPAVTAVKEQPCLA